VNHKIFKKSRLLSIIVLAVLGCLLMALPVLAAGDGSGGGQGVPLGLDSSIPSDGQKDVPLTGDIKLTFNKNVIFLGIRDANKTCFALIASDGSKVPIEVIMADDQTTEGFELRRNISIRPVQKLQPATAYVVKVSPQLQAKNGTSLGHEVSVNFVTAGVATKPVETTPVSATGQEPANTNQTVNTTAEKNAAVSGSEPNSSTTKITQTSEVKEQPAEEKSPVSEPGQNKQKSNTTYAVAAGLILLAALGYVYFRKRNIK